MKFFHRRVLLGLCVGVCALALPAVAAANINPALTLTPNGPAGATTQPLTYDLSIKPNPANDAPTSITTNFPAGLWVDSTLFNPGSNTLCVLTDPTTAVAQNANCQIGAGTATLNSATVVSAAEYLAEPSSPDPNGEIARVLLVLSTKPLTTVTGEVTVRPGDAGLNVAFGSVPASPQITDLHLTLTHLRLPSSCAAEQMTVNTVSSQAASESTTAPFTSTGCPSQPYAPKMSANVKALGGGAAQLIASIKQTATEAPSKSIELDLPASLRPNLSADAGCLSGTPCKIGTASAITPLAPATALAHGTVMLGGTMSAPNIAITFRPPYALSFVGTINLATNSITVSNIPDVSITSLVLDISRSPYGSAFTTNCTAGNIAGKFNGQGGQSATFTARTYYGTSCITTATPPPVVGKPTTSGSLSGLATKQPVLQLHLKHGSNAPNLRSVTIGVGSGLSFSSKGLVKHKTCTGHGSHRKCKTTTTAKGLSITGATLKSVQLSGGKLVITFRPAASDATIVVRGPLMTESTALHNAVKKHTVKSIPITMRVTDATGTATTKSRHLTA